MAARGSPLPRHSGSSADASGDSLCCATSVPTSAAVTVFVIDQPGSGVSAVKPGA